MIASAFVRALYESELVSKQELREILGEAGNDDFKLAVSLFDSTKLLEDRRRIGKVYGDSINVAHIHLEKSLFQESALAKLNKEIAQNLGCIPVYVFNGTLTVAVSDPRNEALVEKISKIAGTPISTVFAFPSEIMDSIEIQYRSTAELEKLSNSIEKRDKLPGGVSEEDLKSLSQSTGIIKIVNGLLMLCLKHGASDIHIQPMAKKVSVRYRIDGELRELLELNKVSHAPVVSRLKVMAKLDITQKRLPQDGRVELELKNRVFSFRLSILPTVFGEKAVIRALGNADDATITPLDDLGLSQKNRELLDRIVSRPNGILFVTGPTGSGKTTTLYSILGKLQEPAVNIVTVEDPVEITLDGITQVQANQGIGLDFAVALRSILRQDPEVILVGEIRDLETAKIASEAALTGHLVMASLHTNNALQAITRLIEIGVEPYLVAPSVIGVVAQRLVRRICENCKESYEPSREELESLFYNIGDSEVLFYRGKGCEDCSGSGYAKRLAIHEVLTINDAMRDQIASNASIVEMEQEAIKLGFKSLRYDGILKVLQGLTTIEEINKATVD